MTALLVFAAIGVVSSAFVGWWVLMWLLHDYGPRSGW